MAAAEPAQVPEALEEVTVLTTGAHWALSDPGQRNHPAALAGFPVYNPDLLARLEQGEEAWIPDIQSSEDEEPARPLLRLWARKRKRWKTYRDPGSSSGSNSSHSASFLWFPLCRE
ncbi:zinc finger protein 7-like [Struthio camelus]|uniref:zinc finger protein 7-like n=1 Tax=Struthio camelus TaxID=8801 RepID=UPI003603EB03